MKELAWIDHLRRRVPRGKDVLVPIGDDCAVVRSPQGKVLLKSDLFVEDVHFKRGRISARTIGMRAVGRVLSDFAACGGRPRFLGVSLGKGRASAAVLKQILAGVLAMARRYRFALVGGDTCRSDKLFLDVWGVGEAKKPVLRSGAQVGDYIFITGPLGRRPFYQPFTPRLAEAQYLVKNFKISAMIDISDGFALDLFRLLTASRKGAIVSLRDDQNLYRGEDYELIFTVSAGEKKLLQLRRRFVEAGRITAKAGGYRFSNGQPVIARGYTHDR